MDVENAMLVVQLTDGLGGGRALEVLHIVAYFATEDIDTGIFLDLLGGSEETATAVELLKQHSLVQSGENETSFRIEKEVQEKVQKLLKEQGKEKAVLETVIGLLSKVPVSSVHAMSVLNAVKDHPDLMKKHSSFPMEVMQVLMKVDKEASHFGREALNVLKGLVGEYHPASIALQRNLGLSLLLGAEKPCEALKVLVDVYTKTFEVKGEREISQTLSLIAKITSSHTPELEPGLRKVVFGARPVSETNNNSILSLWCEYALMLGGLKMFDAAVSILNQVLEKRLQLLHPDDDDICAVEEAIGHMHLKQNDSQKALEIFQKIYEKRKNKLGENCIKTTYTRRGIADAYQSLDMLDKALVENEAVAEKLRLVLGEDDDRYLSVLGKVAHILYHQKELEKSYDLYTRVYAKFVAEKGEEDMETVNMKHELGMVLLDQGKTQEALPLLGEVMQMYFAALGPDHPDSIELVEKIVPFMIQSSSECNEKLQNAIEEGKGETLTFELELNKGKMRAVQSKLNESTSE